PLHLPSFPTRRSSDLDLLVVDVDAVDPHLAAKDRDTRLEIRRLDVGDETPLEAAAEPLLERRDVARRPVRREHDLRAGLVQRVEDRKSTRLNSSHEWS